MWTFDICRTDGAQRSLEITEVNGFVLEATPYRFETEDEASQAARNWIAENPGYVIASVRKIIGRPAKAETDKFVRANVTLAPDVLALVDAQAEVQGVSRSALIAGLIMDRWG